MLGGLDSGMRSHVAIQDRMMFSLDVDTTRRTGGIAPRLYVDTRVAGVSGGDDGVRRVGGRGRTPHEQKCATEWNRTLGQPRADRRSLPRLVDCKKRGVLQLVRDAFRGCVDPAARTRHTLTLWAVDGVEKAARQSFARVGGLLSTITVNRAG
jgi:hypothetical protein